MYVHLNPALDLGRLGFPWINGSIDVPVRHFECLAGPRSNIDAFLNQPLSVAERIQMLKRDVGGAAYLANMAKSALTNPSKDEIDAFKKTYGYAPDSVPKGGKETIGTIVRRRYEGTFRLLDSGSILYSCGLPAKAGGPERTGLEYQFKASPGEYWIALGRDYWIEPFSDDRFAMILMAALKIAYGRWVTEKPFATSIGNLFCYAKFAFLVHEAEPPPFVQERCPEFT